jgi:hypothetical protein
MSDVHYQNMSILLNLTHISPLEKISYGDGLMNKEDFASNIYRTQPEGYK